MYMLVSYKKNPACSVFLRALQVSYQYYPWIIELCSYTYSSQTLALASQCMTHEDDQRVLAEVSMKFDHVPSRH